MHSQRQSQQRQRTNGTTEGKHGRTGMVSKHVGDEGLVRRELENRGNGDMTLSVMGSSVSGQRRMRLMRGAQARRHAHLTPLGWHGASRLRVVCHN